MCYYDSVNDWVKHMNGDLLISHNKPPFLSASAGYWCALFMQSLQVGYHWRIINFFAGNRGRDSRQ